MAAKVLTPAQQSMVDAVSKLNLILRTEQTEAFVRARAAAKAEVANLVVQQDLLIRQAVNAGVPLIEFRRKETGLRTTNPNAVLESLKRTESQAEVIAAATTDPNSPYRIDGRELVIVTPKDETDAIFRRSGIVRDYGYEVRASSIAGNGVQLVFTTPSMLYDADGLSSINPPYEWAWRHQLEAIEFWKANVPADFWDEPEPVTVQREPVITYVPDPASEPASVPPAYEPYAPTERTPEELAAVKARRAANAAKYGD